MRRVQPPGSPCAKARPPPARRYAFTVVANITVYGAAWLLLHLQGSAHRGQDISAGDQLGVQDVPVFRVSLNGTLTPSSLPSPERGRAAADPCSSPQNLALLVVGVGAIFSLLFHLGTEEGRRHQHRGTEPDERSPLVAPAAPVAQPLLLWKHWLREPAFYQVCRGAEGNLRNQNHLGQTLPVGLTVTRSRHL